MNLARTSVLASPFRAPEWNVQAGKVAQSIGTPFFHEELIRLLAMTVATDAFWIIRYAGETVPDVVFTHNISAQVKRVYSEQCAKIDPFSGRWRSGKEPGVFTLDKLRSKDPAYALYSKTFLDAAGMEDELAIFLPVAAHSCFAIVLEREKGLFDENDVHLLTTIYPAIEKWYQSHFGWLFDDLKNPNNSTSRRLLNRPTIIFDHAGECVYSNDMWADAVRRGPALKNHAVELVSDGLTTRNLADQVLRAERLGPGFPLAPNGTMLVLEKTTDALPTIESTATVRPFASFTRREKDVLRLVLKGMTNLEISKALGVGAASIRNVKTRLYRKSGVVTEGELVLKFLPFADSL